MVLCMVWLRSILLISLTMLIRVKKNTHTKNGCPWVCSEIVTKTILYISRTHLFIEFICHPMNAVWFCSFSYSQNWRIQHVPSYQFISVNIDLNMCNKMCVWYNCTLSGFCLLNNNRPFPVCLVKKNSHLTNMSNAKDELPRAFRFTHLTHVTYWWIHWMTNKIYGEWQ